MGLFQKPEMDHSMSDCDGQLMVVQVVAAEVKIKCPQTVTTNSRK